MSRGELDDDADAPPPTSGELSRKEVWRILSSDPGVRNYLFAALAALALVFVVLFQRGVDPFAGFLVIAIGVGGIVLTWSPAGPVVVAAITYFTVFPFVVPDMGSRNPYEIEDNRFNFSDILLIGSTLVYLACHYRVLGMTKQALPHEMKLPRKSDKPYRRPPSAITPTEIPTLLYLAAALVFAGQVAWLLVTNLEVDVGRTVPLKFASTSRTFGREVGMLSPNATRFVLISGGLFFGTMIARLVFGYWRLRVMKPDEASMTLLDTGWSETRRENVRLEVWRNWRKKKLAEREAKRQREERARQRRAEKRAKR